MKSDNYSQRLLRTIQGLEEEVGVTDYSVKNAATLIGRFGKPDQLDFKANQRSGDYVVIATWEQPTGNFVFTFTGFAWGYNGTAPAALDQFLVDCGCKDLTVHKLPLDDFGKTDASWRKDGKFTA